MRRIPWLALGLVACGGTKPTTDRPPLDVADARPAAPADAAPAATPDAAPAQPTTFTVPAPAQTITRVKKGKGKLAELRYRFAAGTVQVVDVAVDASVEVTITGAPQQPPKQTIPRLTSTATAAIVSLDGDTAVVRMSLDAAGPPDSEPGAQLAELKGTLLELPIDARGQSASLAITSRAADQETATTIAALEHARLHTIVFPAEPIGVGGTWRVVAKDSVNGITADVTTTYKLVARKGDVLTITGQLVAKAPPQTLSRPEGSIEVKAMTGKGTLEATVDLARPAPVTSFKQVYDATMQIDAQALRVVTSLATSQTVRDR